LEDLLRNLAGHSDDRCTSLISFFGSGTRRGSLAAVARACEAEGVRSKKGKKLVVGSIESMLKNRVYVGELRSNGGWVPGAHKPIIEPKVFEKAQERFGEPRTTSPEKRCYILTGLLVEKASGLQMSPHYIQKEDKRYYYYRVHPCYVPVTNAANVDKVKVKSIPTERAEELIVKGLADLADDKRVADWEGKAAKQVEDALRKVEDKLA